VITFALIPHWTEFMVALVVGLLLFGGKLPEIAKDLGRSFFKLKRTMNDIRKETGLEDTIRDLKKDVEENNPVNQFEREVRQKSSEAVDADFEPSSSDEDSKKV
jgi:TatA/E family protein of Tat protein translocase